MRLNRADRAFMLLLGLAVIPYFLVGVIGCGLLSLMAIRFATGGWNALSAGPGDLRPAAVILMVIAGGTISGLISGYRQFRATVRLGDRLRGLELPIPPQLAAAASGADLDGLLQFADADDAFSFTYGLASQRVVVSRGLLEQLSDEQLQAVLEHERYHVRHRDPLKVVVTKIASSAYFFLPALRGLRTRYAASSELAADRRASRRCGKQALAGALFAVVRGPAWPEMSTATAIGGPELLEVRISQLEHGNEPPTQPLSLPVLAVTVASLALLVAGLLLSIRGHGDDMLRSSMGNSMGNDMSISWTDELWWLVPATVAGIFLWRHTRHSRRVDSTTFS